jgi:hypothetical protein
MSGNISVARIECSNTQRQKHCEKERDHGKRSLAAFHGSIPFGPKKFHRYSRVSWERKLPDAFIGRVSGQDAVPKKALRTVHFTPCSECGHHSPTTWATGGIGSWREARRLRCARCRTLAHRDLIITCSFSGPPETQCLGLPHAQPVAEAPASSSDRSIGLKTAPAPAAWRSNTHRTTDMRAFGDIIML